MNNNVHDWLAFELFASNHVNYFHCFAVDGKALAFVEWLLKCYASGLRIIWMNVMVRWWLGNNIFTTSINFF